MTPDPPESDHDLLIEVRNDVKHLTRTVDSISEFLKNCPAHRLQLEDHLKDHDRTRATWLVIVSCLGAVSGAIISAIRFLLGR